MFGWGKKKEQAFQQEVSQDDVAALREINDLNNEAFEAHRLGDTDAEFLAQEQKEDAIVRGMSKSGKQIAYDAKHNHYHWYEDL